VFALRNARITDHHWSTANPSVINQLHQLNRERPVVYLFTYWDVDECMLHAWVVPEDVAFPALDGLPTKARSDTKTVEISPDDHQLQNAPSAPNFEPYYLKVALTEAERAKLVEAIKTDDNVKQERAAEAEQIEGEELDSTEAAGESGEEPDESDSEAKPGYSAQSVAFLLELPEHVNDKAWHQRNRRRYQQVLRAPSQAIVDELRSRYIQRLNPAVAGGKRHLSILKKNDYGKGGYHDYYWYAFYDPSAGSKTKSVQLYVRLLGRERVWGYGMAMGEYCAPYLERLSQAIATNSHAVAGYVRRAPDNTIIRLIAVLNFVYPSGRTMHRRQFATCRSSPPCPKRSSISWKTPCGPSSK
jgi:hypothetical protein